MLVPVAQPDLPQQIHTLLFKVYCSLTGSTFTYLLTYLFTYLLAAWSRVLEKLTGSQLVKKFPAFYGNRRLVTAFTSAHQMSPS